MIAVLDYGVGNVGSVIRMIERAGGAARKITTSEEVRAASKLVIPGVGAFDHGMAHLEQRELLDALHDSALRAGTPVLGICLGMHLMCRGSEEGGRPGLSWVDADVCKFQVPPDSGLRVPHMGWNTVDIVRDNPLLPAQAEGESRFYFVHSYHVRCHNGDDAIATTHYGDDFVSAFQRDNLFGVQFHPEKSHRFGMGVMRRFVEYPIA
jgi:imidazole glycerol-phosphate synthase subunit HisH